MVRHVRFVEEKYPGREQLNITGEDQGEEQFLGTRKLPSTPSPVPLSSPPVEGTVAESPALETENEEATPAATSSDEGQVRGDLTYCPPTEADRRLSDAEESRSVQDGAVAQPEGHSILRERRYPTRKRNATALYSPSGFAKTAKMLPQTDPASLTEAFSGDESSEWRMAVDEELSSLEHHKTWVKVPCPPGSKVFPTKFIFRRKIDANGNVYRYKARLVVQGFYQGSVVNTYAPVADFTTVRVLLAVGVQRGYIMHQLDVKTAFLHGEMDSQVYVSPPQGVDICTENEVLNLKKGLYGLKQAPRLWYRKFCEVMVQLGFRSCKADDCLFYLKDGADEVWLLLYVDDIIVLGSSLKIVESVKRKCSSHVEIKDLGVVRQFLGVSVHFSNNRAWLSQEHFTRQILMRFEMENCNAAPTPMVNRTAHEGVGSTKAADKMRYQELLGALLFLSTRTRPDIALAVGILCRHSAEPTEEHWTALKRVLRYLKGTSSFSLLLQRTNAPKLVGYCDADWAGEIESRRSTSGTLLQLGDSVIDWRTVKQKCVALSSTEAEHLAISELCKKVLWLRTLLAELGFEDDEPTTVFSDNQGALCWLIEGVRHAKHVSIRRNFVKEQIEDGIVKVEFCPTLKMTADIFTKPLARVKFEEHRKSLGVLPAIELSE